MEELIEYPNNIKISGSRTDDDQFWRIPRIHRILGYAQALADIDNNEDWYLKIKNIYDHKGILTIIWKTKPSENEKEYLQDAWESIITNYESNPIKHNII